MSNILLAGPQHRKERNVLFKLNVVKYMFIILSLFFYTHFIFLLVSAHPEEGFKGTNLLSTKIGQEN